MRQIVAIALNLAFASLMGLLAIRLYRKFGMRIPMIWIGYLLPATGNLASVAILLALPENADAPTIAMANSADFFIQIWNGVGLALGALAIITYQPSAENYVTLKEPAIGKQDGRKKTKK